MGCSARGRMRGAGSGSGSRLPADSIARSAGVSGSETGTWVSLMKLSLSSCRRRDPILSQAIDRKDVLTSPLGFETIRRLSRAQGERIDDEEVVGHEISSACRSLPDGVCCRYAFLRR